MGFGTFLGAGMVGYSLYLMKDYVNREVKEMKQLIYEVLEIAGVETIRYSGDEEKIYKPKILDVSKKRYGFDVILELPTGYSIENFKKNLPVIEQSTSSKILVKPIRGKRIKLQIGTKLLKEKMLYHESLLSGRLAVPYFTSFGVKYLDFDDEASCHLIVAGASRMGKSIFLRLLMTHLMLETKGNIKFFYINNKIEDAFPFQDVPNIGNPAETEPEALAVLELVRAEIYQRKEKLRKVRSCVNVKQYNQRYPNDPIPPIFVVIDEYGRFSDSDCIQDIVQEISETAGYLDVHLVIATQRPDAHTVLRSRIRANILARVCFQTSDEANSMLVVHSPDAFNLDRIKGRAIVLDGLPTVAQIPYISETQVMELLKPYRKEVVESVDETRQANSPASTPLPRAIKKSLGNSSLPGSSEPDFDYQSDYEAVRPRRSRNNRSKTKR